MSVTNSGEGTETPHHGRVIRRNVQSNVLSGIQRDQVIEHGPRLYDEPSATLQLGMPNVAICELSQPGFTAR